MMTRSSTAAEAGQDSRSLRQEVEATGTALAEAFGALLNDLEGRPRRPSRLAEALGITTVTASRLLRAVAVSDPVSVVQQIPGIVPLRRTIDAAETAGGSPGLVDEARSATARFEGLIRAGGGHRSSLNTVLSSWMPESRRAFEIRRRQAAYKAISELRGIHCDLELTAIALHPSAMQGTHDLLSIQGLFGLDRLSPDAPLCLGTRRIMRSKRPSDAEKDPRAAHRGPRTLEGEPALEGMRSVRLDEFCCSMPAPFESRQVGDEMQYILGPTGFGPGSSVDLVIAELNPGEVPDDKDGTRSHRSSFFQIPTVPTQSSLFDLLLHEDVYRGEKPELLVYDTTQRGPAPGHAPERAIDLLDVSETLEELGQDPARRRYAGYPRYTELLAYCFGKLGWKPEEFRVYRVRTGYPLHGSQICMAFRP